jgi:hypothetical protein
MSTTAKTIETIKTILGDAIEAWADEQFSCGHDGSSSVDALELLDIDEDEAIARFGESVSDLLCKVEIDMNLENIEVERQTYWDPGYWVSRGEISVTFSGTEVDTNDFTGWHTTGFSNGRKYVEIASGTLEPEDGLCDGLAWKKVKAA